MSFFFFLNFSEIAFDWEPVVSGLGFSRLDLWRCGNALWVEECARHLHKEVPPLPLLVFIDTKR